MAVRGKIPQVVGIRSEEKTGKGYSPEEIRTTLCNYIYLPWGDSKKEMDALKLVYNVYTKPDGAEVEREKNAVEVFLGKIIVKGLETGDSGDQMARRANFLKMAAYICTAMESGEGVKPFEGDLGRLKMAAETLAQEQQRAPGEALRGVRPQG